MGFFTFLASFTSPDTSTLPNLYNTFYDLYLYICLYLGLFITLRSVYRFVRTLYMYDVLYYLNIYRRTPRIFHYAETGDRSLPWAFVTNVGTELGAGFAQGLAELGFNVVLHDSDYMKAQDVLRVLRTNYRARDFRLLVPPEPDGADDDSNDEFFALWAHDGAGGITLKVFVNVIAPAPALIPTRVFDLFCPCLDRRVYFPTLVLLSLTPLLARFPPTLIINVEPPKRLDATHAFDAPCRAYIRAFTLNLARKMKGLGKGVDVINLKVGHIGGPGAEESSLCRPSVSTFVRSALSRVGCGEAVLAPYLPHAFMEWWPRLLPRFIQEGFHIQVLRDRFSKYERDTDRHKTRVLG